MSNIFPVPGRIGIGSDFYDQGSSSMPVRLEDVSRFPNLFAELLRRGWSGLMYVVP
jgi:membrane dipeptidase